MWSLCIKGVEQFLQALDISPQSVSAQYGLASGLLGLAKECINLGAFRWGASLLEEASSVAKVGTHLAGNISCIWKLHGDIQLAYAKCFPWTEQGQGLEFDVEAFNASILSWKQTCCIAAVSAKCSYQRALHMAPWQANIYTDIAIASDLISSLNKSYGNNLNAWQLSEKMALGALLLEGDNIEFWVALGCLSDHDALKQHALIRGLQLNVSLAVGWAYLGKGSCTDEAFESCLRAVQILPLAEFQIGLAKLALLSGHLSSSLVLGAIQQAVQHAPHSPESHNLNGLVCESRFDYQSAAAAYRRAHCAISSCSASVSKSYTRDISLNLARSLTKAGNALDALLECEKLNKEGMLDAEGLQIYAFSLWQLGKQDLALSLVRNLAVSVSTMEQKSVAAPVSFICRMLYCISGLDSAISSILKMPKKLFQNSGVSFVVSAIYALDQSNRLESVVSSCRSFVQSPVEVAGMHFMIALTKVVKHGTEFCLGVQSGVAHLRKALHMFPNSSLMRSSWLEKIKEMRKRTARVKLNWTVKIVSCDQMVNSKHRKVECQFWGRGTSDLGQNLLGYLLLSSKGWNDTHVATRCCNIDASDGAKKEGLKSASEILGAGAVACYAIGNKNPKFSFPTCTYQCLKAPGAIQQLQKCLHQEPWNHNVRYLLILNFLQKAREERFPHHLCIVLERLISVALSSDLYTKTDMSYQKFQLLLSASEIRLQSEDNIGCINHAKNASTLLLPDDYLFFSHLQLCRAYAAESDSSNLQKEYIRCLELKTDYHIGWICLKFIELRYNVQNDENILELSFKESSKERNYSWNMWMAVFNLVWGLISLWNEDFLSAEEFLTQACSLAGAESCLFLCHGATCMELARQLRDSKFLSLAVKSLAKAQEASVIPLPIVSALLAQAEGSLDSKEKWEKNLRLEWFSWPPEMRPAELFFQMHLLARQSNRCPSLHLMWSSVRVQRDGFFGQSIQTLLVSDIGRFCRSF
ncbi:hypothetical protein SLA2020_429380 [Shorea laevis]